MNSLREVRGLRADNMTSCFALLAVLVLAGGSPAQADDVPLMTVKIFNDDPSHWIYPVLTTGKGDQDIWLQAFFKVPANQVPNNLYPRGQNYRVYISPSGAGIAPGLSVSITLPLYTQLVPTVIPSNSDQYIDWWNGATIQVYVNDTANPPKALTEALEGRPNQQPVTETHSALPLCAGTGCQPLQFFSDDSDLPKNDPSQLVEYTLGARIALPVTNPATDPPNALDLRNVDFDVSYVNLAFAPAAMGPVDNDQVGYVGTPQEVEVFRTALDKFLTDFPGWPRFVRTYNDGTTETLLKIPSPLELFSRLTPGALAPPDLQRAPNWPMQLWPPVEALRTSWKDYAGSGSASGLCQATVGQDTFCDAIVDAKKLMSANYNNYLMIFPTKCKGTPIALTDDKMIAHVYGWAPFTEAATGEGCGAADNLLEDTPGYMENNYAEYLRVKQEFDKLNYGTTKDPKYVFNPWVVLIHGSGYVNAPNVYAYSVDDAVGNIQADGLGFIIDVGSTEHLENPLPAAPPITINYAIEGPPPVEFTSFRICKNDAAHDRAVNPFFASFIINANDPAHCPVFFLDNKSPPQLYAFTVATPPPFTFFANQSKASWSAATSKQIACGGNQGGSPFQPSSETWCCDKSASNGVFAFSTPEPHNAHNILNHFVIAHGPDPATATPDEACNLGQ
jgi:hypothetical protein